MATPPFQVVADYVYASEEADDLQFDEGQLITVENIEDDEWYFGSYTSASGVVKSGIFPQNFVHPYTPPKSAGRKAPQPPGPSAAAAVSPVASPVASPVVSPVVAPVPAPVPVAAPISEPAAPISPTPAPAPVFASAEPAAPATEGAAPARKKNAFSDRIAAFNSSSQTPLVPFGQPKAPSFVKKPFVAAPSNSYVPSYPPSIPHTHTLNDRSQHSAPPPENVVHRDDPDEEEEQQPRVSLKDRIKLLQQQQQEEQARLESLTKKKHKPKTKKEDSDGAPLEPITSPQPSVDGLEPTHTGGSQLTSPDLNIPLGIPAVPVVPETTTYEHAQSIPEEDAQERSEQTREAEEDNEDREDDEEDEEEEEIDEEEARRIALRERMAKISGGMGMVGMINPFGFPGTGGPPPKTKKKQPKKEEEDENHPEMRQAPVPILPGFSLGGFPGALNQPKEQVEDDDEEEEKEIVPKPLPPVPVAAPAAAPVSPTLTASSAPIIPTQTSPVAAAVPSLDSRSAPIPPPQAAQPPALTPQSPPRNDLNSVIDSYRNDSDDDDSDDDWGEDQQPKTRKAHPLPPLPPAAASAPAVPTAAPALSEVPPPPPAVPHTEPPVARAPPPLPVAHNTESPAARAPPPPPPADSSKGILPPINTSPILAPYDDAETGALQHTKSHRSKRESFNLSSMRKSLDYDEVADEELGDDEHTESEDSRRPPVPHPQESRSVPKLDTKRSSYIAGSGTIPPVPMSPSSLPQNGGPQAFSARGPPPLPPSVPGSAAVRSPTLPGRVSSDLSLPSSPPPPPPPGQAPPSIPYRNLIPAEPAGESSEEVTGYEADEDTDLNQSALIEDELHGSPSSMAHPRSAAPPPPPPPHAQSSPLLGHVRTPSSAQSAPRAAPPPPPPGAASTEASAKSPEPESSSRFSFRRTSSELTRSASKRHSQNLSVSSAVFEDVDLPTTIDLSQETGSWWLSPEGVPRALLARRDVRYEVEEQVLHKRGGRSVTVRDIYVLFSDYSQEVITVEFAAGVEQQPAQKAAVFTNKITAPPAPHSEQLEAAYEHYGQRVLDVALRAGAGVTAGTGFVESVVQQVSGALGSVGGTVFGFAVYLNRNNATVRQFDEVRAGDIVTLRYAKFSGHKGGLHQKYSVEAGRSGETASGIITEYDATKRKVRVLMAEEGGSGKLKTESFRINDLKNGEVKVFRVVGRDHVGW